MDWQAVESELAKLANKISLKPDILIGIARGGVVPARILVNKLGIECMYCLSVQKQGSKREVTTKITADISGKTVLLVEDVLESGASLQTAKIYLESLGATVKTAALYITPATKPMPDFYLKRVEAAISFPWEY